MHEEFLWGNLFRNLQLKKCGKETGRYTRMGVKVHCEGRGLMEMAQAYASCCNIWEIQPLIEAACFN